MRALLTALRRRETGIVLFILIALALLVASSRAQEPEAEAKGTLQVIIEGVEGELRGNVEAFLDVYALHDQEIPGETRLRWLHARAEEQIRTALQPFGYYRPQIETSLEQTGNIWTARYTIAPGEPIKIARLDFQVLGEGAQDPAFQKLLKDPPLAEGQVLEHARYEELKQILQRLAAERGYFDAHFTQEHGREQRRILVDLEAYQASVILHFDAGVRYRFGEVTFHQDVLNTKLLHRYHEIEPGDPYQVRPLLNLQSALIASSYFEDVEVSASPDKASDHTIPIDVNLTPDEAAKYTFGAGFGTDTGVRGRAGVELRRINRRGHRFRAELLASQVKFAFAADYIIPGADPRTDSYSVRSSVTQEETDAKDLRKATLGVNWQRERGLWLGIASLEYLLEQFTFGDEETTSKLLMPSLKLTRIDADDRLNVDEGSRLHLEVRGASEFLLSDVTFLQGVVAGKYIRRLWQNGRILVRGDVGLSAVSDFAKLPASVRFFTGGDTTVRGYSLDSIGPENDEGDVIGGRHLLIGSIEYEHRIKDKWSVAAFVDAGDAFDTEAPNLRTGVGAGVRWQSPIGPVRVDLAHGLQEPGDLIRLHLVIGPDL